MKFFEYTAALATLCMLPVAAQASNESDAHITGYIPQLGGQMFFITNGQRTDIPGCAIANTRWVIDDTTPAGQALVAGMLTAYASDKAVSLVGTGDCGVWQDTETVSYFFVH